MLPLKQLLLPNRFLRHKLLTASKLFLTIANKFYNKAYIIYM